MSPEEYDAWYGTPRGRWIGETEYRLVRSLLGPAQAARVLDVGCGTGWFTRRLAQDGARLVGVDVDRAALAFAVSRGSNVEAYVNADATRLPFADRAFDAGVSVTALCFVPRWHEALRELIRVARSRIVIGLLHRHSALWLRKGRAGGTGAYRGAHWHTRGEIEAALRSLPVRAVQFEYAVFDPSGTAASRALEHVLPSRLPLGSFIAVRADVAR